MIPSLAAEASSGVSNATIPNLYVMLVLDGGMTARSTATALESRHRPSELEHMRKRMARAR